MPTAQTPYDRAMRFVHEAMSRLKLSKAEQKILETPEHIHKSTVSFKLDNGSIKKVPSYRVQFNSAKILNLL
jgi:glutamate dehydrogenase/leucine dehydrogenase